MNGVYKFTSQALPVSKKGVLKPDSDGAYTLVVGGLNIHNSMNQFYTLEGAKELFEQSSSLMRRMQRGAVKGEVGHPRQEPGMSMEQYVNRLYELREDNICCHFKDVTLDANYGNTHNMPGVVAVLAKVTPSGPYGPALEKALQNPGENVCFSVRGLTDDYYDRGQYKRVLKQIIGWDWVTEPGIAIAEKFKSPGLESQVVLESLGEISIVPEIMEQLVKHPKGLMLESSKEMMKETLTIITRENNASQKIKSW